MGAGIIIVNNRQSVLALITHTGLYDLPKGKAEDNESVFETAQRECFEECDLWIEPSDLLYPTYLNRNGTRIFLAKKPSDQSVEIKINKETNRAEHIGYCWISFDEFLRNTYPFLRTHMKWARMKITNDDF